MKKCILFFVLLVAILTLILVAFACQEDIPGKSASAEISTYSRDGIVRPNLLDYYNFSGAVSSSYTTSNEFLNASDGLYYGGGSPAPSVSGFLGLRTYGGLCAVVYTVSSNGNYAFAISARYPTTTFQPVIQVRTSSGISYSVTSSVGTNFTLVNSVQYNSSDRFTTSYYTAGTKVVFFIQNNNGGQALQLANVKLEKFNTSDIITPYNMNCYFTGFVIPDYSYTVPEPDPSPYDSWNGVVAPNLLNDGDFFQYPYYSPDSDYFIDDLFSSDVPTSYFTWLGYDQFGDSLGLRINDTSNVGSGVSLTRSLNYRFTYKDLYSGTGVDGLRYNLTFTLSGVFHGNSLSISMVDNLNNTRSYTFNGSDFNFNYGYMKSLTLYDSSPSNFDYVDITVTFTSFADSALIADLNFAKLEIGTLFTGFVPYEHGDFTVVLTDLMPNYNFADVPLIADVVPNSDNWVRSDNSNATISRNGTGLRLETVTDLSLIYEYIAPSDLVVTDLCFSLQALSDTPFTISIYELPFSEEADPIYNYYFLASFIKHDISFSFTYPEGGFRIVLDFDAASDITLYYSKLEQSDVFTGYCPSFLIFYNDGFSDGYNDGYLDGTSVYGTQSITLAFDNVESPYRIEQGFLDWGYSSVDDLFSSQSTLFSYFYDLKEFPVLSYGSFGLTNESDNSTGFCIWISRDEGLTFPNSGNYISLNIWGHYCYLTFVDTDFPSNWNPVSYPNYRTFVLTLTSGLENLLEQVGDSSYQNGKNTGFRLGYNAGLSNGEAIGYSNGIKTASNGNWRSLVSALIDVPVTTIVSFLDFDVLGFNLLSALRTLILFSLFFYLLKLLAGKLV